MIAAALKSFLTILAPLFFAATLLGCGLSGGEGSENEETGCGKNEIADKETGSGEDVIVDQVWEQISGPGGGLISFIVSRGQDLFAVTGAGLHRSRDEGKSWELRCAGIGNGIIRILAFKDSLLFAGTDSGLFRSSDHGLSWIRADRGIPQVSGLTQSRVVSVAGSGNTLLATTMYRVCPRPCVSDGSIISVTDVHMSTDDGDNWTDLSEHSQFTSYNAGFAVTDSGFITAGSGGVFHSADNGGSWRSMGASLVSKGIKCLAANGNIIFAGTLVGVFRSMDYGATWIGENQGLENEEVVGIAALDRTVFALTAKGKVFRSTLKVIPGQGLTPELQVLKVTRIRGV